MKNNGLIVFVILFNCFLTIQIKAQTTPDSSILKSRAEVVLNKINSVVQLTNEQITKLKPLYIKLEALRPNIAKLEPNSTAYNNQLNEYKNVKQQINAIFTEEQLLTLNNK